MFTSDYKSIFLRKNALGHFQFEEGSPWIEYVKCIQTGSFDVLKNGGESFKELLTNEIKKHDKSWDCTIFETPNDAFENITKVSTQSKFFFFEPSKFVTNLYEASFKNTESYTILAQQFSLYCKVLVFYFFIFIFIFFFIYLFFFIFFFHNADQFQANKAKKKAILFKN